MRSLRTGRSLCCILLLWVAMGGLGCGGRKLPPQEELVFALGSNPNNLDPRFALDAFSDKIARLIFSPLLERMPDGSVRGHLAESFSQPDPKTYVLHLRKDVSFHNGQPLTSADVAGTYNSILDPELKTVKRNFLKPIKSIETPDAHTPIFLGKERPEVRFPRAPMCSFISLRIGAVPTM